MTGVPNHINHHTSIEQFFVYELSVSNFQRISNKVIIRKCQ